MSVWRGLVLSLAVICAASAAAQTNDTTEWLDAAQDSNGMIWGVPLGAGSSVFVHDGSEWNPVTWSPAPRAENARPVAIAPGADGYVRMIWKSTVDDTCWLTQHRWPTSAVVAQFKAKFANPEFLEPFLFVDSRTNVWITHKGPTIFRKTKSGGCNVAYTIPQERLINLKDTKGRPCFFEAPRVLEDDRGHLWFWMDGRSNNVVRMDSFIEFDGANFIPRSFSGISPDARCYALAPEDAGHLLASFRGGALYRIDLSTFAATRIEDPVPNAFRDLNQIFRSNGANFVVSPNPSGHRNGDNLWRWKPGERPQKVADGLGTMPVHAAPWLQLPNGIILGAPGNGLVFVPASGDIETLDWASKVAAARTPQRLFRTSKNNLLLVSGRSGSATTSLPPWPAAARDPAFAELNNKDLFARDSRGHIWAVDGAQKEVQEWDGLQWKTLPVPFAEKQVNALAVDTHDRIWLFDPHHGPYVWDQNASRWSQWADKHEAFENYLREDPHFVTSAYFDVRMASSGDGRAIIRHGKIGSAEYFDGRTWRMWRSPELPRGLAQFDGEGHLVIANDREAWEWQNESWIPRPSAVPLDRPKVADDGAETVVGRTPEGQNIVLDQNGDQWMTEGRRLYRVRGEAKVPVFRDDQANPFLDGRGLMNVIVDVAGNVFLETNARFSNWVMLRAEFLRPVGE